MTPLARKSKMRIQSGERAWPELSGVQRWFQAVVTHPDGVEAGVESPDAHQFVPMTRDALEIMVTRSERLTARDRMAIYANAYYARLLECLGESFPVLKRTLGEEAFNGFAFGYLQQFPSSTYTLGKLGEHFSDYLNVTRPDKYESGFDGNEEDADWPDFLIDLTRLEWTISEIFDGPGIENTRTVQPEDLKAIRTEDWPHVRIQTGPCLRLLQTRFPLNTYYTAARRQPEDVAPRLPAPGESYIAVTRRDYIVRRHDLTRLQYLLLRTLQQGATLGDAIAKATADVKLSDEDLSLALTQSFRDWTRMQFFMSIVFPDSASRE